LLLWVYNHIGL